MKIFFRTFLPKSKKIRIFLFFIIALVLLGTALFSWQIASAATFKDGERRAAIAKWALTKVGVPYLALGACASNYTDKVAKLPDPSKATKAQQCDSATLVSSAYKYGGLLDIPTTANGIFHKPHVPVSGTPKPGDIYVLTSSSDSSVGSHLGLYISSSQVIHARFYYKTDSKGNVVKDKNGNKVIDTAKSKVEIIKPNDSYWKGAQIIRLQVLIDAEAKDKQGLNPLPVPTDPNVSDPTPTPEPVTPTPTDPNASDPTPIPEPVTPTPTVTNPVCPLPTNPTDPNLPPIDDNTQPSNGS